MFILIFIPRTKSGLLDFLFNKFAPHDWVQELNTEKWIDFGEVDTLTWMYFNKVTDFDLKKYYVNNEYTYENIVLSNYTWMIDNAMTFGFF